MWENNYALKLETGETPHCLSSKRLPTSLKVDRSVSDKGNSGREGENEKGEGIEYCRGGQEALAWWQTSGEG